MYDSVVVRSRSLPTDKGWLKFARFCCERVFMKLFQANSVDIVKSCQSHFWIELQPSVLLEKRVKI